MTLNFKQFNGVNHSCLQLAGWNVRGRSLAMSEEVMINMDSHGAQNLEIAAQFNIKLAPVFDTTYKSKFVVRRLERYTLFFSLNQSPHPGYSFWIEGSLERDLSALKIHLFRGKGYTLTRWLPTIEVPIHIMAVLAPILSDHFWDELTYLALAK